MSSSRALSLLAFALTAMSALPAHARDVRRRASESAHIISIERLLLPRAVADRIEGSGVKTYTYATRAGSRDQIDVGSLRIVLSKCLAVRGGVGMAHLMPQAFLPETQGLAASAAVTWSLWRRGGYSIDVDISGMAMRGEGHGLNDGTLLVAFRAR